MICEIATTTPTSPYVGNYVATIYLLTRWIGLRYEIPKKP